MTRRFLAVMLGLVILAVAAPSRAQSAEDKKEAFALFNEGRKLMSEPGRLAEACEKLAKSHKVVPRGDTLLNLAECNRLQGKSATAWKQFGDAIRVAEAVKFDRAIDVARKRHADLEAKLSFLTLAVPPETAALAGFEVTLNGYPVPRDAWGKSVPVDPATFEIAAKADGRLPFSESVKVGPDGDKRQVTVTLQPVPVLLPPAPPPPAPRPPPPPPPPAPPPPRIPAWTWAVGGVGVAALGVGAGFGVDGLLAKNQLNRLCGGQIQCTAHTPSELSPLNSRKDVGLGVLLGAGAVGLAGVTVAVVRIVGVRRAPARTTGAPSVTPLLGAVTVGPGGAALGGRF